MQLLVFNYKKAIGEPLTNLLKKYIETKMPNNVNHAEINSKIMLKTMDIVFDENATKRYLLLTGQNKVKEKNIKP